MSVSGLNPIQQLRACGQSAWYDNIGRSLITSGRMAGLRDSGITGVTSNPAIFNQAISGSDEYSDDIADLAKSGMTAEGIYEYLATRDVKDAADVFRPVYDATGGNDGYISLEVSPEHADKALETAKLAIGLQNRVPAPNIMIKVPATDAGIAAIELLTTHGVNVNATLIFSVSQYRAVADAYIRGIGKFIAGGGDPSKITSVASVFISRIDTVIDKKLDELIAKAKSESKRKALQELKGKAAIANAKLIYQEFSYIFTDAKFTALKHKGAKLQRPLWASTSTKNPAYSDTIYVTPLIGHNTVNTLPDATYRAFLDHGTIVRDAIVDDVEEARRVISCLRENGIDIDAVCAELLDKGVSDFQAAYGALLASIEKRRLEAVRRAD